MLIDSLFTYYFFAYLLIYQFTYSVFGKRFNPSFVFASNIVFGLIFYESFSSSLGIERFVYILSVLIGNAFVVRQNFKFNDRLWSLVSLQLQLGTLLISLPNILLSFIGLILVIFSFGRSFSRRKEFVLNAGLVILLLVFCLLVSSWSSGFSIESITSIINEHLILLGFLSFFPIYGLWRCFYEVTSIESNKNMPIIKNHYITWLWIGIFNNFFIILFNDLNILKERSDLITNSLFIVTIVLLILLFLKTENVKSLSKHISYTIIAQAAIISFLIIEHSQVYLHWLIYTNISLILGLVIFREDSINGCSPNKKKLKFITQLILILMLIAFPFSPWFESNLILLEHFKNTNTPVQYIAGLLFLGVRYRQNIILLIGFIRQNYSKEPKAS
jgi:hypothetical protein